MSGPNPPDGKPEEELESAGEISEESSDDSEAGDEPDSADDSVDDVQSIDELEPLDGAYEQGDHTSATDIYSRAYSAPESEQFTSGYVPPDLYDYDEFESEEDEEGGAPRWPWVVGVAAILAAVALVASVAVLVTRSDTSQLANPGTTTSTPSSPPFQDQFTTTTAPPPTTEVPTATETQTVTVTPSPSPPATTSAPPPPATSSSAAAAPPAPPPPPTSTTPAGPKQVTYSVTGTKAPGDIISVTYVDASGRQRTIHNVYIPWSMTVTPISQSDVGSVQASSLLRWSKLNCSITTSDGQVLSQNSSDQWQTSC